MLLISSFFANSWSKSHTCLRLIFTPVLFSINSELVFRISTTPEPIVPKPINPML